MRHIALSIDVDTAKNLASGVSIGSVVIAVAALVLVKNMVMRVVSLVLFLALGLGSYSQRSNLTDCVDKVRAAGGTQEVSCTFFGQDVTIPAVTE